MQLISRFLDFRLSNSVQFKMALEEALKANQISFLNKLCMCVYLFDLHLLVLFSSI